MNAYRALLKALWRSQRRDPVGLFFSFAFAPVLVLALGAIFGNDPRPEFGGQGFLDATLPAFASLVLAMTGVLQVPVAMLTLRDTGALRRLSLTPLRRSTFIAASLTVHFVVGIAGMLTALAIGIGVFGVPRPSHVPGVLAVCLIGLSTFLAVGCALAALYPSATAATGIGNVLMILLMLTSGAFTPLTAMPSAIQQIVQYSPVRWFVEAAQHAWDGDPLAAMIMPVFLLCVVLAVAALVGRWRFQWVSGPMTTHANAALTPRHRLKVARLVVDEGWPISEIAARFQVSWPTVKRWVDRYVSGESMQDGSSRPKNSPTKTSLAVTKRCISLRMRLREGPVQLAVARRCRSIDRAPHPALGSIEPTCLPRPRHWRASSPVRTPLPWLPRPCRREEVREHPRWRWLALRGPPPRREEPFRHPRQAEEQVARSQARVRLHPHRDRRSLTKWRTPRPTTTRPPPLRSL